MRKMILALVVAFGLTACTTPAIVAVNNKEPQSLMKNCEYATPPEPNKYKAATWTEKESMWKTSYDQFVLLVSECNSRLKQLRILNTEQ